MNTAALLCGLAAMLGVDAFGYSDGLSLVSRRAAGNVARTNSPVLITAVFTNRETADLRGFTWFEEVPSALEVLPESVKVNGEEIADYWFGGGLSGEVHSGCTPWRWTLEVPPSFGENHLIPPGGTVEVSYSLRSRSAGVYYLRHFAWAAVDERSEAHFGHSEPGDQLALTFLATTNRLPTGQIWRLWWQHENGQLARWTMIGTNRLSASPLNPAHPGGPWWVRSTFDLNRDGEEDVLFQHTDGRLVAWIMQDTNRVRSTYLNPRQVNYVWKVMASGDFNQDGHTDLLFENTGGWLQQWLMNGTNRMEMAYLNPAQVAPSWQIVGTANLGGDTRPHVWWENSDGTLGAWIMDQTNRAGIVAPNPRKVAREWRITGVVDLDGDGRRDLLWQNSSGVVAFWLMDGTNCLRNGRFPAQHSDARWKVVGPQ